MQVPYVGSGTKTLSNLGHDSKIEIGRQLPIRDLLLSFSLIDTSFPAAAQATLKIYEMPILIYKLTEATFHHLSQVTRLNLIIYEWSSLDDQAMSEIGNLSALYSLVLWGTNVADAWLPHLTGLTGLGTLDLGYQPLRDDEDGPITDAGLPCLAHLTQLNDLNLSHTGVTDAGLSHLAGLTRLGTLGLGYTHVTDFGLPYLASLTRLRMLDLSNCQQVTDMGLQYVTGLRQLDILSLSYTQVTDAGLTHLTALPQLRILDLSNCNQVTDAGLQYLTGLTQLCSLNLCYTKTTRMGQYSMKQALPNLKLSMKDTRKGSS